MLFCKERTFSVSKRVMLCSKIRKVSVLASGKHTFISLNLKLAFGFSVLWPDYIILISFRMVQNVMKRVLNKTSFYSFLES